jgi:hypothetical protein
MGIADGGGAARSFAAVQHGHFAEELSGLQFGQGDFVHVFVDHPDTHRTAFHHIQRVAAVMFVEYYFAIREVDLIDLFGEFFQFPRLKPFENRNAGEALRLFAQVG